MWNRTYLALGVWLLTEANLFAQVAGPARANQEIGPLQTVSAYAISTVTFFPYTLDMAWQIPLGGRVAWVSTSVANPTPGPTTPKVFLLRGTGTIFTPGFGEICANLRRSGIWAEDLGPAGDRWVCRYVINEHRAGRLRGPIILVGHSRGARHVLDAARELEKADITVDLLVCLDASLMSSVPKNVRQALNLFMSQPRLYPAERLRPSPGATTRIENIDLTGPDAPDLGLALCHVNIAAYHAVQDLIIERIEQVALPTARP